MKKRRFLPPRRSSDIRTSADFFQSLGTIFMLLCSLLIGISACENNSSTIQPPNGRSATVLALITQTAIDRWTEDARVDLLSTAMAFPAITPTPGVVTGATATALAAGTFQATFSYLTPTNRSWINSCPGIYEALFACMVYTFNGQAPLLGKVQVVLAVATGNTVVSSVPSSCFQTYEAGIINTTLDDTIKFIEQGTKCDKGAVKFNTFTIIGGTGKFRHATGLGLSSDSYSEPDKNDVVTYTERWNGTLQLS